MVDVLPDQLVLQQRSKLLVLQTHQEEFAIGITQPVLIRYVPMPQPLSRPTLLVQDI